MDVPPEFMYMDYAGCTLDSVIRADRVIFKAYSMTITQNSIVKEHYLLPNITILTLFVLA